MHGLRNLTRTKVEQRSTAKNLAPDRIYWRLYRVLPILYPTGCDTFQISFALTFPISTPLSVASACRSACISIHVSI